MFLLHMRFQGVHETSPEHGNGLLNICDSNGLDILVEEFEICFVQERARERNSQAAIAGRRDFGARRTGARADRDAEAAPIARGTVSRIIFTSVLHDRHPSTWVPVSTTEAPSRIIRAIGWRARQGRYRQGSDQQGNGREGP